MKIRNGFISNSSSSSFIIGINKTVSHKLENILKHLDKFALSCETYCVLKTIEDVLNDCDTSEWDLVKDVKYNKEEKMVELIPISVEAFNEQMNDEIAYWEFEKNKLTARLKECEKDSEDYEYFIDSLEMFEDNIIFYTKYKEMGIDKIILSDEYISQKKYLEKYLNVIDTQDIWKVVFRRDGEAPKTELEDVIAKLTENEFKEYLKREHDIDVNFVEKYHY